MKYFFYILLSAGLLLTSCERTAPRLDVDGGASVDLAIPVRVAAGSVSAGADRTKATDDFAGLRDKSIGVYAFLKNDRISYTVTSADDSYICLLDATTDGLSADFGGREAKFDGPDFYARWTGRKVIWPSGERNKSAYDFFAYCIDKVEDYKVRRTDDSVSLVFDINGTQDLLLSKAALTKEQTGMLNSKDKQLANQLSFSHFTAIRNINPVFSFRHQLVRLDFEVAGEEAGHVGRIAVLSPKKAVFNVAHKNESRLGVMFTDNMNFASEDAESLYALTLDASNTLFAAPSDSYKVFVTMTKDGRQVTEATELLPASDAVSFNAGKSYNVRLTIDAGGNVSAAIVE